MIRVCLFGYRAYGYDVTGWVSKTPNDLCYDNLLTEDLVERINEGNILMYFPDNESAGNWCEKHYFDYELVEPEEENKIIEKL